MVSFFVLKPFLVIREIAAAVLNLQYATLLQLRTCMIINGASPRRSHAWFLLSCASPASGAHPRLSAFVRTGYCTLHAVAVEVSFWTRSPISTSCSFAFLEHHFAYREANRSFWERNFAVIVTVPCGVQQPFGSSGPLALKLRGRTLFFLRESSFGC